MSSQDPGLVDWLTRQDELLQQLVSLNERLVELESGWTSGDSGSPSESYLRGIDVDDMPLGLVGRALDDIPAGGTGDAQFDIAGNSLVTEVNATNNCSSEDIIEVVGSKNSVASIKSGSTGGISIVGTSLKTDQTTLAVQDQVDSSDESRFAQIDLGRRSSADVAYSVKSGGPSIILEVSNDDSEWWEYENVDTQNQNNKDIILLDTAFRYVRAYVKGGTDDNVNKLVMSAKGI